MRALVQRVDSARVVVDGSVAGAIAGPGLLVLVGVTHSDTPEVAARLARKVFHARLFDAERFPPACRPQSSARELSASDLDLPLLVVSQFTLYADTRKGRRPTWEAAAPRAVSEPLIEEFTAGLRAAGAEVATGVFGADMRVELTNDGPITVLFEAD